MSAPFRREPDPPERSAHSDPFLEFESERQSIKGLIKPHEELKPSPLTPTSPSSERPKLPINPTVAFALAVAGLVTAFVAYYQLAGVLANRSDATAPAGNPSPPAPAKPVGGLEVTSEPAGASVTIDGKKLGVTPLTLREIPSGRHQVVISRGSSSVTRSVNLAAGSTALVTAVLNAGPAPSSRETTSSARNAGSDGGTSGWITVQTPFDLRILERGRLRGTTRGGRINLAEGPHELEFVSDLYQIRHAVVANVTAGQGTRVNVPLPSGSLSINAIPWANVWVDGTPVGTTPLANLALTVGPHEVVFRHPTLGERKQIVDVKAVSPMRVGISFR